VADVERAIGIGKGGGDEYRARHWQGRTQDLWIL
jgi:hypothetical protein